MTSLAQQRRNPPIAKAGTFQHQLVHRFEHLRFVITMFDFVTLRAPRLLQHLTRPSLGYVEVLFEHFDRRSLPARAYQFPSAMCLSI
jgi:hypothetical protein